MYPVQAHYCIDKDGWMPDVLL